MSSFDAMLEPIRAAILNLRRLMPSIRAATVTSVGPVRIQMDGETSPVAATPTTLVPVGPGDRVRVAHYGTTHLILGRVNTKGIPYRMQVGTVNVTTTSAGEAADATISFAAGRFTVAPRVIPVGFTGERVESITYFNSSISGATVRVRRPFTGTITVAWLAVQMTPMSAEG